MPHPLAWNMGRVCSRTSRSLIVSCRPNTVAFSHRLRWVSCTPFGRAVVPDV